VQRSANARPKLFERDKSARFEQTILPHLNAAYNLARWLLRNEDDAADAVQEACLRALKFFGGFRGGDGRTWLLTIVRNTCYTRLGQGRAHGEATMFDEEMHSPDAPADDPEEMLMRSYEGERLKRALEDLPAEFREVVILRELEGLSYKEIAGIADVPVGTVMSRLARARKRLQQYLTANVGKGS
jgi:RNA polymerase sigma-70 factor (ECF subfamily)